MSDLVDIAKAINNMFTYVGNLLHVSAVLLVNIIIFLLCADGYQHCTKSMKGRHKNFF